MGDIWKIPKAVFMCVENPQQDSELCFLTLCVYVQICFMFDYAQSAWRTPEDTFLLVTAVLANIMGDFCTESHSSGCVLLFLQNYSSNCGTVQIQAREVFWVKSIG